MAGMNKPDCSAEEPRRLATTPYGKTREMDKDSFVEALNDDLRSEYQSIVQYISHTATVTGAEFLSTIDELKVHLTQELNHAQILAKQSRFWTGPRPPMSLLVDAATGREALEADLRLEETQLERYRERFSQALSLGLADVAEVLRPLLEQTQEHVRDLRTALGK